MSGEVELVRQMFDDLVKSRFIEMFGLYPRTVSLNELLAEKKKGQWGTEPLLDDSDRYVIKTNHLEYDGTINYECAVRRHIPEDKFIANSLSYGDILVEKSGGTKKHHVGYACIYLSNSKKVANNFILVLTPNDKVEPRFIHAQIKYLYEKGEFNNCYNKTTGIENLKVQLYLSKKVCLPPINEQKAFVRFLEQVDKSKVTFEREVTRYDELIKSRFIEMFGDPKTNNKQWPVKKIKELYNVTSAKRIYQSELVSGGVPFYKVADINSLIDNVYPEVNQFISEEKYGELVQLNQVPKEKDILMTARGTIGQCYSIRKTDKFYFQDGMITWLIPKSDAILNEFFVQYLSTEYAVNEIKKISKGATVDFLSISKTENLHVIVPDISLQKQFLEFIKQVNKSKDDLINTAKRLLSMRE